MPYPNFDVTITSYDVPVYDKLKDNYTVGVTFDRKIPNVDGNLYVTIDSTYFHTDQYFTLLHCGKTPVGELHDHFFLAFDVKVLNKSLAKVLEGLLNAKVEVKLLAGYVPHPVSTVETPVQHHGKGTVSGTVENEFKDPVVGAVVSLGYPLETTVDEYGGFELKDVAVGEYDVSVTAEGYKTASAHVVVVDDQTVTSNFVLEKVV